MNREIRRVVVTGLGAITPVGNSVSETWTSLVEGRCGIGPITLFDTTDFKAKLDAERFALIAMRSTLSRQPRRQSRRAG